MSTISTSPPSFSLTKAEAREWQRKLGPASPCYLAVEEAIRCSGKGASTELPDGIRVRVIDRRLPGGSSFLNFAQLAVNNLVLCMTAAPTPAGKVAAGLQITMGIIRLIESLQQCDEGWNHLTAAICQLSQQIRREFQESQLANVQAKLSLATKKVILYGELIKKEHSAEAGLEINLARDAIDKAYEQTLAYFKTEKYPAYQALAAIAALKIHIYEAVAFSCSPYANDIPTTINETISFLEAARNEWKDFQKYQISASVSRQQNMMDIDHYPYYEEVKGCGKTEFVFATTLEPPREVRACPASDVPAMNEARKLNNRGQCTDYRDGNTRISQITYQKFEELRNQYQAKRQESPELDDLIEKFKQLRYFHSEESRATVLGPLAKISSRINVALLPVDFSTFQ